MWRHAALFVAGALLASLLPDWPSWLLPGAAAFAVLALLLGTGGRLLAAALAGILCHGVTAKAVLDDQLAPALSGNEFTFAAQVIEIKFSNAGVARLVVTPDAPQLPARVRLNWYEPNGPVAVGEHWRWQARLRRPRGSRNPGGFDFAGWLFRERIGGTGYVLSAERLDSDGTAPLAQMQAMVTARLRALLPAGEARAALLAIATGDRDEIAAATWRHYAATGTSHLMAISGLHIGMTLAAVLLPAWLLAGLAGYRGNLRLTGLMAALPAAAAYAALSGFAVPARRALAMAVLGAAWVLLRRRASPWPVLALAAALIVAADPLAVLAPGFLLSFAAVAALLAAAAGTQGRRGPLAAAQSLLRVQVWLGISLLPLTAWLFDRVSLAAPFVNLLGVPLFTLLVVPSTLAGTFLPGTMGELLLRVAWYVLDLLHAGIAQVARLPFASLAVAELRGAILVMSALPFLYLLLPPGFPGRRVCWLSALLVLAWRPAGPPPGCADLHTLDVGQGLAVVVRTTGHVMVYDTGPSYRSGGDSGQSVLLPFLRSRGLRQVDVLVVSHADDDHAGGVESMLAGVEVRTVLAGEPLDIDSNERACRTGQRWHRDGVIFEVLHPRAGDSDGNDASCVIAMRVGAQRALLTGDISRRVEFRLAQAGVIDRAVWVQVPHHGSQTSSSLPFVTRLAPDVAVVSAGFANRWGFPRAAVAGRWTATGSELRVTGESGALHHRLCPQGLEELDRYRDRARRYWHD